MTAEIVFNMDEATYHARPELSSTEARIILNDTPATYRWKKDNPPLIAPSKKFDLGSAIHSRVLGTGYEVAVIPDEMLAKNGAASTTEAKAFIENARAEGKVPLKQADLDPIAGQAEAVMAHSLARALLEQPGHAEASVFAEIDGVPVRARFDFLPDQGPRRRIAVDLKSTADASKRAFEKSVASYGYDVQRAFYLDALAAITGPMPVDLEPELLFIAVQKEAPYLVGVYQLPTVWAVKGHGLARKARGVFAECTASGVWPGLSEEAVYLDEPTWHLYQTEEDHGDAA